MTARDAPDPEEARAKPADRRGDTGVADLPPLREVIAAFGIAPRKSLGQNFLFDLNLTRRIARAGGPLDDATIVEVGPGPGGLTRALLLEGARDVVAIERDPRATPALQAIADAALGRLTLRAGDALETDYDAIGGEAGIRVVANLPYNVGTALLVGWLTAPLWPPRWKSLTLMFQKEVAERIVAAPGTAAYGRLSVLAQWRSRPRLLFEVPPQAFTPPPKVTSAVVRIEPGVAPDGVSVRALEAVTAAAFGQRRKMLRASLRSLWPQPEAFLETVGIAPTERAERVPVEAFVALARLREADVPGARSVACP